MSGAATAPRHHGTAPFFLGCRKAGEIMGTDRDTAAKRLKMLVADGVIELVAKGTRGRASEYRYRGDP